MKIRIKGLNGSDKHSGIFGGNGEIPVGTEIEVAKAPAGWAGRYDVISDSPKEGAVALTNKNKAELLEIAAAEGVTVEDGATNDDIKAAIELAREAK
ncbi:hypothetical protein SKP52_02590 [Sphingopyxis fribergensis]|uniref:Uncharacterized protein n=2 Tax=Sphingopyxis fribergensis TaxID=1515612 RepID=A0A0A7PDZ3_9SPHN|nr:hypothetical protein SKP52_02590 [Sphingopyxis fribergensis]